MSVVCFAGFIPFSKIPFSKIGILGERSGLLRKCGVADGRDLPMESAQDHAARWRPCCAAVQGHCLLLVDHSWWTCHSCSF